MIEVSHLTKTYGNFKAVDDLSFRLVPGEILGFLGPNGAGKSTTMKMLTGFLGPTSGQVSVWGHDLAEDAMAAQTHIGYLPEGAPAWEEMTALEFLRFIAQARGLRAQEAEAAVESAIATMSLSGVRHQKIETLSKGFKRRVGLAQAILHDPDVLILDEPTDGLDPNQKHQVREMIKGLSREKIVIISTHILEEVSAVCNRVMVLAAGRIVADTTPADLLARSDYHGAVTVVLEDEQLQAEVVSAFDALGVVSEVRTNGQEITVLGADGLFSAIFDTVQARQWPVSSVYVEQGRIDDVFRRLTSEVGR